MKIRHVNEGDERRGESFLVGLALITYSFTTFLMCKVFPTI